MTLRSVRRDISISQPALGEEEWQALREPIMSGWLTQGAKVASFEKKFAVFHEASFGLAVTSCTTGLHLALTALGVGPGDEVIVPAFTWVATANVVLQCGAKPVFVDVDRQTFNMDPTLVEEKVTKQTKAIIPVHLFGLCADIAAIRSVLPSYVHVIEDAACAAGARYHGRFAGTLGDVAVFSFHPRKIITTGEGGMITTDNHDLAALMNQLRNHGASISEEQRHLGSQPYLLPEFNLAGFNYRMTDLQGAVGLVQMERLKELISERRNWAVFYKRKLGQIPWLHQPIVEKGFEHSFQAYVCYMDERQAPFTRNEFMQLLQERGIATRPGTHAVHNLAYYRKKFMFDSADYSVARDCDLYTLAIPLHNQMTKDDYIYVVEQIMELAS